MNSSAAIVLESAKPRPWTSSAWIAYYRNNAESLAAIPWSAGGELTSEEAAAITKSVQAFQLGESSDGAQLQRCADEWSRQSGDSEYAEAIRLFIREEQRHSLELGHFMDLNGIPRIQKTWSDSLFRSVRHFGGLEVSIMVLLTAEIVAQVYYQALLQSTSSQILRGICVQILHDEEEHVRFQCERLAMLAQPYNYIRLALRYSVQRALMLLTLPIVWIGHRSAYRAGGFTFGRFASETWLAFSRAVPRMHPRSYADHSWERRTPALQPDVLGTSGE